MTLREAENRLPKNIKGITVTVPYDGRKCSGQKLTLELVSGSVGEQTAFLKRPGSNKLEVVDAPDILEWEVESSLIIEDGDTVTVDATHYGLSDNEKAVVTTVNIEDASPYPIKVRFANGRRGQYARKECVH